MLNRSLFNMRIILVMLIVITNIFLSLFQLKIVNGYISFYDFEGQWKLTAYALQGVDPYPLIGINPALIDSIGSIPKGWGTSPWGLLLGNFFYPGFLSIENAKIYFICINLFVICITALCALKKFKKESNRFGFCSFLCVLFSFWPIYSLTQGNAGGSICYLLFLTFLFYDTKPHLAGVLLGLSMIKPQVALIVCVAFLFMKQYRIVVTAFSLVILSLLLISGIVNNNPFSLINEFMNAGIGNHQNYSGIFTLLFLHKPFFALLFSMIFGVIFIGVLSHMFPISLYKQFSFLPASCVATFWCYSFYNELSILLLSLIIGVFLILYAKHLFYSIVSFIGTLFMTIGSFILIYFPSLYFYFLNKFSFAILQLDSYWINQWIARTIFETGIIVLMFLFLLLLRFGISKNAGNVTIAN